MQGLGVGNPLGPEWAGSTWVHVEAQYLGVVRVEGVLRVGWQRVCWLPVLHLVQLLLNRPGCTGAAEQTVCGAHTYTLPGKTHPDRRPEGEAPVYA